MGNSIGEFANVFKELADVFTKNPKGAAAVAVAVGGLCFGYAAGYRDGRNESDQNNQKLLANFVAMYNPLLK